MESNCGTTRFICSKCNKVFNNTTSLSKHLSLKKVDCNGTIDTNYWLQKQLKKQHERYNKLQAIAELDDEIINLDEKKKILKAFYLKVCNILKIIENNREVCPSISDDDVIKVKVYIQNCKTGDFYETKLNTLEE